MQGALVAMLIGICWSLSATHRRTDIDTRDCPHVMKHMAAAHDEDLMYACSRRLEETTCRSALQTLGSRPWALAEAQPVCERLEGQGLALSDLSYSSDALVKALLLRHTSTSQQSNLDAMVTKKRHYDNAVTIAPPPAPSPAQLHPIVAVNVSNASNPTVIGVVNVSTATGNLTNGSATASVTNVTETSSGFVADGTVPAVNLTANDTMLVNVTFNYTSTTSTTYLNQIWEDLSPVPTTTTTITTTLTVTDASRRRTTVTTTQAATTVATTTTAAAAQAVV